MFPNRTISSGDGSFPSSGELGRNSSMPSLKARPLGPNHKQRFPPHFAPPCNPHIFDAARFVCEKVPVHRPRYLDRDREKHVTRWLMEAQDALERMEPGGKKKASKKKPFLRRFHSQDSNKDYITSSLDESWNENFILADGNNPKKTKALLKRFQPQTNEGSNENLDQGLPKSLDTTFDRSESNGSRRDGESPSPQSTGAGSKKYSAREFLEKYSLPRVVAMDGEVQPLLLYKHLASYTRVEAVRLVGKKGKPVGKPVYIPEGYQGWFAIVGDKGSTTARSYSTLDDLVKAHVPYFLPSAHLPAYLLQRDPDSERWSYIKGGARAGTPLRLAGIFVEAPRSKQRPPTSSQSPTSPLTSPLGSPLPPTPQRYAQLVDPNMTELYAPLSTKGEFFPISSEGSGGMDSNSSGTSVEDGLQRLTGLLKRPLPLRVRLVAGPAPPPALQPALTAGTLLLRAVTTESVIVTCTLPEPTRIPNLTLLSLNTDRKLQRSHLGYDTEKRMFLSSKIHKALTYCQMNVDTWIRQITFALPDNPADMSHGKQRIIAHPESISNDSGNVVVDKRTRNEIAHGGIKFEKERRFTFQGFKADASRLFGKSDKILKDIPDENEGSIIFLSKNELENMNYDLYSDDEGKKNKHKEDDDKDKHQQFADDRMKVFRENSSGGHPKLSKWFKHLKILRSTERLAEDKLEESIKKLEKYKEFRDPFDPLSDKHSSIERYQDMSKLIEDRFGASRFGLRNDDQSSDKWQSYRSLTTSSDLGIGSTGVRSEPKRVLTKSVSVQTGILDSPFTDDRMSDLGQKKNLSVEQINYYSENDSSLKKKQIYSGNCAKRLENDNGKPKISRFERRQRIRPDLIPEKSDIASSDSFDQIQSCEDLNAFGTGSSRSEQNEQVTYKQHSFITEKLCSEFHVKTKRVLSKSTSNLLHGKDKKDPSQLTDVQQIGKSSSNLTSTPDKSIGDLIIESDTSDLGSDKAEHGKLKRSISSIQNRKLPVIEDLPYGQVADAISRGNHERRDSEQSDNIYAEICNPELNRTKYPSEIDSGFDRDILLHENTKIDVKSPSKIMADIQFRHIEVVVIERNNTADNNSIDSDFVDSDSDEKISENVSQKYSSMSGSGGFSAGNSLEKENTRNIGTDIFNRSDKLHAIRLEVTHNNSYEVEMSKTESDTDINIVKMPSMHAIKNGSYVKFSQGINITDEISADTTGGIYNTLK